jgi:hypothetical protein
MKSTVFKPYQRQEGEVIPQGLSYNESIHFYSVFFRREDNILRVYIHKTSPKEDWTVEESVKNEFDDRLWLGCLGITKSEEDALIDKVGRNTHLFSTSELWRLLVITHTTRLNEPQLGWLQRVCKKYSL